MWKVSTEYTLNRRGVVPKFYKSSHCAFSRPTHKLPENSRLELWSKPGQRRKETLSIAGTVRKRRLMSPQEPFNA
jgi:hypothetical protein